MRQWVRFSQAAWHQNKLTHGDGLGTGSGIRFMTTSVAAKSSVRASALREFSACAIARRAVMGHEAGANTAALLQ
jgi:hypothetical protein